MTCHGPMRNRRVFGVKLVGFFSCAGYFVRVFSFSLRVFASFLFRSWETSSSAISAGTRRGGGRKGERRTSQNSGVKTGINNGSDCHV